MNLVNKNILITGGFGFLGRWVIQELKENGVFHLLVPKSSRYDLRQRKACRQITEGVDIVIHLAAQIGGIGFISEHPGEVFYNNLIMGMELMEAARLSGVKKFVSIGTVCEYPRITSLPFQEKNLWDGYPDRSTASYGWAKKMLIVQGKAYREQYGFKAIHLLPVNLYGPGDNFQRHSAHVIPSLIRKIIEARENNLPTVEVWGSGKATREFLYVEDAAKAIVLAAEKYDDVEPLNLGSGEEISIKKTAELIMKLAAYQGKIVWNSNRPDGQPRRNLDTSKAKHVLGFSATTTFEKGLKKTINWYENHKV